MDDQCPASMDNQRNDWPEKQIYLADSNSTLDCLSVETKDDVGSPDSSWQNLYRPTVWAMFDVYLLSCVKKISFFPYVRISIIIWVFILFPFVKLTLNLKYYGKSDDITIIKLNGSDVQTGQSAVYPSSQLITIEYYVKVHCSWRHSE